MTHTLIRNAKLVNEGRIDVKDVYIKGQFIERIDDNIGLDKKLSVCEINAEHKYLFPGVIDAQVHFREPGLTHKADIFCESKAAVAGGVTSFMDMPNTKPATLTQALLEEKYQIAAKKSLANYSFFMGVNHTNLSEALRTDTESVCGISDDGLYFDDEKGILANYPFFIEELFSKSNTLIALHSEDEEIIEKNLNHFISVFNLDIPVRYHPKIRSAEACYRATERIVGIAKKHSTRLHVLHLSSKDEVNLFDNTTAVDKKRITTEACVHHLLFSDKDYTALGNKIKWNPSIKTEADRQGLLKGLLECSIDIISTDHAPHLLNEKTGNYLDAKPGGPLIQYSLQAILELYFEGLVPLIFIPEKMSHNVAKLYKIKKRGFLREGYYADMVLVDFNQNTIVNKAEIISKCQWSPFESKIFKSKISRTWVNGNLVYNQGVFDDNHRGMRLKFEKDR
jgi:dihydroorotase